MESGLGTVINRIDDRFKSPLKFNIEAEGRGASTLTSAHVSLSIEREVVSQTSLIFRKAKRTGLRGFDSEFIDEFMVFDSIFTHQFNN